MTVMKTLLLTRNPDVLHVFFPLMDVECRQRVSKRQGKRREVEDARLTLGSRGSKRAPELKG